MNLSTTYLKLEISSLALSITTVSKTAKYITSQNGIRLNFRALTKNSLCMVSLFMVQNNQVRSNLPGHSK
jgi:hypothetical protein